MNDIFHHQAIKALAEANHGGGRLEAAERTIRLDNPLCGDRIDLGVRLGDGCIDVLAHATHGCLLCRASASIIGLRAPGRRIDDIAASLGQVRHMLSGNGPVPLAWAELEILLPARHHASRHGCVLLPFQALHGILTRHV